MVKKQEKSVDKMMKDMAIKAGETYFDNVILSLKDALEDAKNAKKEWKLAIKGKPYDGGKKREHRQKIEEIIKLSCSLYQKLNLHQEKAMRAILKISQAFQ